MWWLIHPTTKQAIAAFEDPRTGAIRELTLPQCIEVWGAEVQASLTGLETVDDALTHQEVQVKNQVLKIPKIPKKFIKFAHTRRSIHREIANMSGLDPHENVLRLEDALELVQDSKCTTFLVLELAGGGELFDRIKLDCGTDEDTARRYFRQLISGVAFCHVSGVCHRDLKPENLLLADSEEYSTLKIADFGLSAIFAITDPVAAAEGAPSGSCPVQSIRRLRSIVGSPHYVAPEVLMDAGQGYDGAKADAWSIGVILYAMVAGNLPFGKDLLTCMRYDKFRKWSYYTKYSDDDPVDESVFPSWFFPTRFSMEIKSLVAQLLYPDACMRLSVEEAQTHPWVLEQTLPTINPIANDAPPGCAPENELSPANESVSPSTMLPSHTLQTHRPTHGVMVNIPPNTMDLEPHWGNSPASTSTRSVVISPHAFNRISHNHGKSSPHASLGFSRCPPSPQQTTPGGARPSLHAVGRYMPSLDETSPLRSGQTPQASPRASPNSPANHHEERKSKADDALADQVCERQPSATYQFDQEVQLQDVTEQGILDEFDQLATQPSTFIVAAGDQHVVSTSLPSNVNRNSSNACRFISPPLAPNCPSSSQQHQFRRNSPPELFLRRFDKSMQLEAIQTRDLEDRLLTSMPWASSGSASMASPPMPRHGRGMNSNSAPGSPFNPPSYHDHVARSTRFVTSLPASIILAKIEDILAANPSPLPYPYKNVPQRVAVDWEHYQLEVRYGGVLTCTVRVFLLQRGVYLVEFRRGQVEIFQFKRFYEDIREKLSESMNCSTSSTSEVDLSMLTISRKRNKSVSARGEC